MATIGGLMIELSANVARLEGDMKQAVRHTENTERMMKGSIDRISSAFASLGVSLSIGAFALFIKNSIDAADDLSKLAEKTGTAVDELAGLKFAAEQNATSLDSVTRAGQKLSTVMFDKPEMFKQMGISATDSTEAMLQLADIFAIMPDGVEKTAIASKLFGDRLSAEMIPFLNQGAEELRALIEQGKAYNPVTEESAQQAADFNDNLDALRSQASALGVTIANDALPGLSQITSAMTDAAREGGLLEATLVGIGGAMTAIFTDDLLSREQQIVKELATLRKNQDTVLSWGGDPNFANEKMLALQRELEGIQKTREAEKAKQEDLKRFREEMAAMHVNAAQSRVYEMALSGASEADIAAAQERVNKLKYLGELSSASGTKAGKTTGTKGKKTKAFDPEGDFWFAVDEAQIKNRQKAREEETRAYARAVEEANRVIFDIDPIAKASAEWERLVALKEQGLLTDEQIGKSYAKTFADIDKSGNDAFKSLESAVRGWGNQFTDEMVKMMRTGKVSFSNLADSIINDLLRIQVQKRITDNVVQAGTSFLDNFSWGNIFGGGKAVGGPVMGGTTYLVGEKGPELFTPQMSGSIIPNHALGGAQVSVSTSFSPVIHAAPGTDTGAILSAVRQLMPTFIAENSRVVVGAVNQAMVSRGQSPIRA